MSTAISARDKALARRKKLQCVDCGDAGVIVIDHTEGNQICVNCGRVAESVLISDQQEWRNFSSESTGGRGNERSRVGEVNDVWMDGGNSTTFIGGSRKMQHIQNLVGNFESTDRYLKSAFTMLRHVGDIINVNDVVLDRGKEIMKELNDLNQLKGRCNGLNTLAVIYMASREVGVCRTLKEMVVYDSKISQKDLGRAINRLKRILPMRGNAMVEDTAQLIPRLCSRLKINSRAAALCEYAAGKATIILRTSHRTTSLAAAIIYFVTQVAWSPVFGNKVPEIAEICMVCGTCESTIKATYKELLKITHRILPPNFNRETGDSGLI
ncbi:transcription initiation factor TFIIB, putative [Babesia bigemina]|uniref:General transcription factor TFIIB n=1 Tax=Babesia bigemina TaxID=5866 RepID=A0A061D1F8_BABBI|nr:transcription initiation factor TFIIB, putative [Babesia bigemina]CDR93952.1 transcription initiation factor TFIIB, putative [Babesia bigemina]|eukprot:XP_012766138.1 transcription initiation factor TFIIB, putative [Babesia bigemina]